MDSNQIISQRLLERLVQAASTGIVITDAKKPDNPIIFANEAFYSMTGYNSSETIGFNCRFLQGKDARQKEVQVLKKAIEAGSHCKVVLRNYRKSGELFWNELYVSPYFDELGALSNFIGIQHDVTEVAEQRCNKDLAGSGSNDTEIPHHAQRRILEFFDKYSRTYGLQDTTRYVHQADLNTSIAEVLKALSRHKAESDFVTARLEVVMVSELLQTALAALRAQAAHKEIQVKLSHLDGDYHFLADRSKCHLAITSLLEIAITYSQPGSKIWIMTIANDVATMIAVVDESSGLPEPIKQQILASSVIYKAEFEDVSIPRSGLTTAAQVMKVHNGAIHLIKSDYSGSEFALIFPRQRSRALEDREQLLVGQEAT